MARALVVYGSTTGNTEMVAGKISEVLGEKGVEVTVKNVFDTKVAELGNGYDLTVLGASTWGMEEIEFQEDFEPFFEEMKSAELSTKKVALFGCGDSSYEYFCGAVDELESLMEKLEAKVVNEPLRIDGDPEDVHSEIEEWAEEVASAV
ncbi:flavodoxin [Desulfosediminicola ganghwensis]|uniref:flavodoxin n=1 Tax=Desulfosediminicola ganghwensis TaxID=2569540 RepID=UPI0010AC129C|nr:flavodoxin [Desulfosediminicola ganghwensis]